MLPSSRRRKKNDTEHKELMTLGDIERYYKKTNTPTDATYARDARDARDNSKIKKQYSKQILEEKYEDNDDDEDDDIELHELVPSYIESTISDKMSLHDLEEEEDYESKFNNGLSIKKHKMTNIRYPFSDKSSNHLTHDLDNIYENWSELGDAGEAGDSEILGEYLVYYINKNAYKPFLEFMLYKPSDDETFYFPNFSQNER